MAGYSICKNDTVMVTSGKHKPVKRDGQTITQQGRVLKVDAEKGTALVENINKIKRHTRPNPGKGIKGGVVEREAPIHVSKLMVLCPACGKPTRVARSRDENGRRIRTCKKCKASLDRKAQS